ncbi:MAG TPA: hypothetical protein P5246_01850 [Candidatus Omnitrophota bacterium]|nr:hypothetical protein [Candidatus Omnitrophota bacterium]HSA31325.1 hypothetical protein [Candidatus Omnitrophota bacterium]
MADEAPQENAADPKKILDALDQQAQAEQTPVLSDTLPPQGQPQDTEEPVQPSADCIISEAMRQLDDLLKEIRLEKDDPQEGPQAIPPDPEPTAEDLPDIPQSPG